tara:strand:+ start:1343 stop:1780 length:438 start_codon:yes stop_codon:yes gene_type:complete
MIKLNCMDSIRKMINLLLSTDQPKLLNEAFYKEPFRVDLGAILDKDETIKIYSQRSSLQKNVKLSGAVLGYDYLLNNLKSINEDNLRGFTIINDFNTYIIFTNLDITVLYGVLISDVVVDLKKMMNSEQWKAFNPNELEGLRGRE